MDEFEAEILIINELRARAVPPHQDGAYAEGIHAGLELAWRIITNTRDEDYVNWDGDHGRIATYPASRLS